MSFGDSGGGIIWKARFILFIGFALLAGGLAGSAIVLTLKYIVPGYPMSTTYFGIANVITTCLVLLSATMLWIAQNAEDEYQYNLSL